MKNVQKYFAISAAAFMALSAIPALAETCPPPTPSVINLNTSAELKQSPDIAVITASVITQNKSAKTAMQDNAKQMSGAFAALKSAGVADKDMQTSGVNLNPEYVYIEKKPPQIKSYNVSNTLTIKIRDLTKVGSVLDALVAQGINQVNGPNFQIEDPDKALDKARADAMKKAMDRANLYASVAGMKVKRVISINESGGYQPPMPIYRAEMAMAKADMVETPVAPGEVTMSVSLSVQIELEK